MPHGTRPVALRVRELLDARRRTGDPAPLGVGALPFAPDGAPALPVPRSVRRAPALHEDPLITLPGPDAGHVLSAGAGVVARPSPDAETAEAGAEFRTFLNAVGATL
ncbi:hypothetical protein [Streptomyces sp. NRRL WC-3549]|uniref:hypothetical protein n=1 Tax=Streptomyces sp. NRRL WC-3549 TaxID=1463925 RepID=UPI0004CB74ED|nr:hypothetical protein [Streptomyces sp. NRRL WC-3549]